MPEDKTDKIIDLQDEANDILEEIKDGVKEIKAKETPTEMNVNLKNQLPFVTNLEISVKKPDWIEQVKLKDPIVFPKVQKVEVTNHPIIKFPQIPKPLSEVGIKKPSWWDLERVMDRVSNDITSEVKELPNSIWKNRPLDESDSSPRRVVLSDSDGNFIPPSAFHSKFKGNLGGGGLHQYTEDAVHASGDVGTMSLGVVQNSDCSLVSADGDYGPMQLDSIGNLKVNVKLGGGGGTQFSEDSAHVSGATGTLALGIRNDGGTATLTNADGDYSGIATDSAGGIFSNLKAGTNAIGKLSPNSGVDIGDVDVTSVVPGTAASNLGKAEDAVHASGDVGVLSLGVANDANTTLAADGDYVAQAVDVEGSTRNIGNRAHDAVDAGAPLKIGAKAETSPKGITLVADGDRTDLYADADGIQLVKLNTSWADLISERISNTDGASTAFTTFDAAAGTRNYITSVTVHNAHASTNGFVDLRDGTAGSVIWTFPLPATGGATHNFNPPLRQPTAATALAHDVSAAITTVYVSVNGFKSKV